MAHASWGRGWPNCQSSHIVTVTANGLRLPVRREIAPLVAALVKDLQRARGRRFRKDWSFGFACRAIRNTDRPSNHSWGLAIDLDAPENPQLTLAKHRAPHVLRKNFDGVGALRSTMPRNAKKIAERHGFRWGGTYSKKPDPMHFEFIGSIADARRRRDQLLV
jgi:hypothetical protein